MSESYGVGRSNRPDRKVAAAGVAGAATVLIVFILGQFGVEIPESVGAAITALLAFLAGYFKREEF